MVVPVYFSFVVLPAPSPQDTVTSPFIVKAASTIRGYTPYGRKTPNSYAPSREVKARLMLWMIGTALASGPLLQEPCQKNALSRGEDMVRLSLQ